MLQTMFRLRCWKFCGIYALVVFLLSSIHTSAVAQVPRPTERSQNSSSICHAGLGDLEISPANMTPRTFNLAFVSSISNNGGDKLIGGAFYYAIEVLEKEAERKNISVTFTKTILDSGNQENKAVRVLADLYCAGNVSAFIGPEGHCKSAGLMATAFNIPYMTYGCLDNHNETNQHRMINTDPSIAYVSKFITAVLTHFHWSSFWLVSGTFTHWLYTGEQLIKTAGLMNITLNGKDSVVANDGFSTNFHTKNPYVDIVRSSKDQTRVYVYLGCYECLIIFLRQLQDEGLTDTGRYAVVAVNNKDEPSDSSYLYYTSDEKASLGEMSSEKKIQKLRAFRNVLLIGARKKNNDLKEFERNVFKRSMLPPFNYPRPPAIVKSIPEMNKKVYHLYDATLIFGLTVMSLMGTKGADPTNTSQVIHYIKGRQHCSKQGYKITIHANGETEDNYEVRGHILRNDDVSDDSISHGNALFVVGSFNTHKGNLMYSHKFPIWVKSQAPVSEPECGFRGEKCEDPSKNSYSSEYIALSVCSVLVVLCAAVVLLFWFHYRRFTYDRKLDRLLWKIDIDEIHFMDPAQINDMSTPRPRKKESIMNTTLSSLLLSDQTDTSESKGNTTEESPIGNYKGCTVFVKQLTRKHLELTRTLKEEFQRRKELTHDNIARFVGACIDTPKVRIVTQYYSRKSLEDILSEQELPQEEMFITSLVQDLITGMKFIHESDLGYHGNLKSSNCLVDRRWTLKITDFGFTAIGPPPPAVGEDERAFAKLRWTAPEFLQRRFTSSNSYISQNNSSTTSHSLRPSRTFSSLQQQISTSNNHDADRGPIDVQAQQKGDVYSFAIILYELYGQRGPWGDIDLTAREIIDKLLSPSIGEAFRPDTSCLRCDPSIINLIQSCWADDPGSRPDFKYTIGIRFKPKQHVSLMELYADNLETIVKERTEQLRKEKKMTENLLLRMLPRSVADRLMRGQPVQPEQFECVTIYFSDIVGFTELSAESAPMEVVNLLNDLYTLFDSVIHKFYVYKVETIGDAYMVVSGLPNTIGDLHAGEIASMSLLFLQKLKEKRFTVRGQTDYMLKIRIGIHSGPCCAGVVGLKMPRYCLFGDTVNTANRMESTGEALKIHCSAECKAILDKIGGYHLEKRGHTEVKGKGQLLTYFLISEDDQVRQNRLCSMTNSGRCVSASNLDYAGTPLNRRSAPPLSSNAPTSPIFNGFRSSSMSLPHNSLPFRGTKNSVVPASLNTSLDSTVSMPFTPNDSIDDTHSITDFKSSTLPRPSVLRQNSIGPVGCPGKSMSPIAEDPWSPSGMVLNEKSFKFHDNGISCPSDAESECDTLLKQTPMISVKRHNSLHGQNSSEHSPIFASMNRHSIGNPETVL